MEEKPPENQEQNSSGQPDPSSFRKRQRHKPRKSAFRRTVNVFLYAFIGLSVLMIILMGFTQTSTFREILRKEVIKQVNGSLNATLNIKKIEGTILTSLVLTDVSLSNGPDTLVSAGRILLKTSPLQLLLKRIYIRNFELTDAKINLLKDSAGVYNFSKLSKSKKEPDTTKSSFPFTIYVADFRLNNIRFVHADYSKRNIDSSYPMMNMQNLRVDSLSIALNAFANPDRNDYQLKISGAKAKVNINDFRLKDFHGNFYVTSNNAKVDYFVLRTNTTDMELYANIDKIHLFDNFSLAGLKDSPVRVDLNVRMFDFADLTHFTKSTEILKGTLKTKLLASGTFGNLKIERLGLDYLQTHLNAGGFVKNLHTPADIAFKVQIIDSYINEPDIAELLPTTAIPVYPQLQIKNLNIDYEGTPLNFKMALKTDLPEGSINASGNMDLTGKEIKYELDLKTSRLNVEPVAPNLKTLLNMAARIKGEGFKPDKLLANAEIAVGSTSIKNYYIDSLHMTAIADRGRISALMNSAAMGAGASMEADLNITDMENPVYTVSAQLSNLNLRRFVKDSSLVTNINTGFYLQGRSFDFHKMESQLDLVLNESSFKNKPIEPTNLRLIYTRPSENERLISLNSDIAEFNIRGNYSIDDAASLLGYESGIIYTSILQKAYEFNPLALFNDSLKAKEFEAQVKLNKTQIPKIIDENMDITYDLKIKDFKLISLLTGINKIEMDADIGGTAVNNQSGFRASNDIHLKSMKLFSSSNLDVFVKNLTFNFDVSRSNSEVDFGNIAANLRLATDRIYSGTDIKNILLQMNLRNNVLDMSMSSDMDTTLHAQLDGRADLRRNQFEFAINKLLVNYNNVEWTNDSTLVSLYSKDEFEIKKFALLRNKSRISLAGKILGTGMLQGLKLKVENLDINTIKALSQSDVNVNGIINVNASADGWMDKPAIKMDVALDSVTAGKTHLGSLQGNLDYASRLLKANIEFLDPALNKLKPLLLITGSIPVDLGFMGVKERIPKGQPVEVTLKSDNFDLTTIADLVPQVGDLKGKLVADLKVGGTTDKFVYSGNLALNDGSFLVKQNNLPYQADLKVALADETITVENVTVKNAGGTDYKGTMTGNGKINFSGTDLKTIGLTIGGDLAVLSPDAQGGSLPVTGRLVVQTDGKWSYEYNEGHSSFNGALVLKNADITFIPPQSSYASRNQDIIYNYVLDSAKIDKHQEEFNQVLALSKRSLANARAAAKEAGFDYNIRLRIDKYDPAKVVVVLVPEANMQLTANLDGEITYNSKGLAQGSFNLQEGSNLSFIKTLNATGKIYFESDITDPRLDLTATYDGVHKSGSSTTSNETGSNGTGEEQVEVRLPLKGSVKELSKNLASSTQNFKIFIGESNIKNNVASPEYEAADAISFIISGKFTSELTAGDKQQAQTTVKNQFQTDITNSILSTGLSGFANAYIGDAVQDIQIENKNGYTNVGLSGKVSNVKYSVGGSSQTLNDISKANVKFEFPFGDNFLLRFERKDQLQSAASSTTDKVNELGLRYKFIF